MAATSQRREDEDLLLRVQDLQARLDAVEDPIARGIAEELLGTVVRMYGSGLERIVEMLRCDGERGRRLAVALADDELVASLLMVHDVHPVPLRERVLRALEQVRPYMESHGGDVELLALEEGVARIKLQGSCSDCAASTMTLELAIKQALEAAAPDLEGLEVDGAPPEATGPSLPLAPAGHAGSSQFELPMVMSAPQDGPRAWVEADHLDLVPSGQMVGTQVGGRDLLVANLDGTLLAYGNACANCQAPLDSGVLEEGTLVCPRCARTYFLPAAGRSLDDERLQLAPFPLLREAGHVKVAMSL